MTIVPSNFGNSIQFTLFDDTYCFIPCDHNLPYGIGDKISCNSIEIIQLSKKGRKDIFRIGQACGDDTDYGQYQSSKCHRIGAGTQIDFIKLFIQYKNAYEHGDDTALKRIHQLNERLENTDLYNDEWLITNIRSFTKEEVAEVESAVIVESRFGRSVCFTMKVGGQHYIPVDLQSDSRIGDAVETNKALLVTYSKKDEASVFRVFI